TARPPLLFTTPRPPHLEPISAVGTKRTTTRPPSFLDQPPPLPWPDSPKNAIFAGFPVQTSSSFFSFNSPPNRSSKAPEVQSTRRRDLRRVEKVWSKYMGGSAEFSAEV
ncbi:hypothetical protein Prudu_012920, partial [Prunus dulcis]